MKAACLIATKGRIDLLLNRSIPSVLAQTFLPSHLIIITDQWSITPHLQRLLTELVAPSGVTLHILSNHRTPGMGGALNSGLSHLYDLDYDGFIAILDDDDLWSEHHIEVNLMHSAGVNIVVSGLQMSLKGHIVERPLLVSLEPRSFLIGNPGWQGSNTFVSLDMLIDVGGFREGLESLNDRDLALRLLRHPKARWALTNQWTAIWFSDTPNNLSTPRSKSKVNGLRSFWRLYGHEMTKVEQERFFRRADSLFGVSISCITRHPFKPSPPLGFF